NFLNTPVLTSVSLVSGGLQIAGTFTQSASPNMKVRIEFFASSSDPLGASAEGQTFLGATQVTTNGNGTASFSVTLSDPSAAAGQLITADATNLTADPSAQVGAVNVFNTSEFSAALTVPLNTAPFLGLRGSTVAVADVDGDQVVDRIVITRRHGRPFIRVID